LICLVAPHASICMLLGALLLYEWDRCGFDSVWLAAIPSYCY
jgi:hypothetical protein